jgi:signal peptidase I
MYTDSLSALRDGKYHSFCSMLTHSYRARVAAATGRDISSVKGCAAFFSQAVGSGSSGAAALSGIANQQVVGVRVTGRTARITVAARSGGLTVTGEASAGFENGRWRVESFPTSSHVGRDRLLRVPSGAMLPTFPIGSRVLVDPAIYRTARPMIGDVVIFHPPHGADLGNGVCGDPNQGAGHPAACDAPTAQESSQTFLKRVVGGPGDRISIVDGHVIRNGVREMDSYIADCGGGEDCTFRQTITVPPGDYFMVGDNRGFSDDSRFWGPVQLGWIIGKVVRRVS